MLSEPDQKELDSRFSWHEPTERESNLYIALRARMKNYVIFVLESCPPSRERSTCLTKLDEALMFATASIARSEKQRD